MSIEHDAAVHAAAVELLMSSVGLARIIAERGPEAFWRQLAVDSSPAELAEFRVMLGRLAEIFMSASVQIDLRDRP